MKSYNQALNILKKNKIIFKKKDRRNDEIQIRKK